MTISFLKQHAKSLFFICIFAFIFLRFPVYENISFVSLTFSVDSDIIMAYYEVEVAYVISTPSDGAASVDVGGKEQMPKAAVCCGSSPGRMVKNHATVTQVESYP